MCGICGFTITHHSEAEVKELLHRMTKVLRHRGPDDEGIWYDSQIALGHRRLSIIDLSPAGHQPMVFEKSGVVISYNGEVYNFMDVRKELEKKGRSFRSQTDTEVILQAYDEYGLDFFKYLNGMFAFALWDPRKQQLLLARDRLGKKPLYYYKKGNQFIFASEIKSILQHQNVDREIDTEALELYLSYGYIPAPWTIFKYVRKILPAHYLILKQNRIDERPYWQIPFFQGQEEDKSQAALFEELEAILEDAVRIRLISDVPIGAFLSGGTDSSAVVTMMSRVSTLTPKTFTIDFSEKGFSEGEDAALVADVLKTNHTEMRVSIDGLTILPKLVWHFDEPFGDSSAIPTYYVSKMARQHVTVILSGDGGDELFAGYLNYLRAQEFQWLLKVPYRIRRLGLGTLSRMLPIGTPGKNLMYHIAHSRKGFGLSDLGVYPYVVDNLIEDEFRSVFNANGRLERVLPEFEAIHSMNGISRLQYIDARIYLPDDILVKVDRMSMANSLETRAPLLDYRLVEFAARLPEQWKMKDGHGKILLKKWLERFLPPQIVYKKKHGFSVPIKNWFRDAKNGFTHELLLSSRFQQRGIFKKKAVEKILRLHETGKQDFSTWIWLLINLELWFQTFYDSDTRKV